MNALSRQHLAEQLVMDEEPNTVHQEMGCVRRLWFAVFHQALCDAAFKSRQTEHGLTARQWLYSDSVATGFPRWVCDILDLDLPRIRRWLSRNPKIQNKPDLFRQLRGRTRAGGLGR